MSVNQRHDDDDDTKVSVFQKPTRPLLAHKNIAIPESPSSVIIEETELCVCMAVISGGGSESVAVCANRHRSM
jgi:hypothetical protein